MAFFFFPLKNDLNTIYSGFLYFFSNCGFYLFKILIFVIFKQIVQEYERAVIFRLGRLLPGGARGPGKIKMKLIMLAGYDYNMVNMNLELCE